MREKDSAQKQKQKLKTFFMSSYSFLFQIFLSSSFLDFPLKARVFRHNANPLGVIQKVRHTQNRISPYPKKVKQEKILYIYIYIYIYIY